MASPDMNLAPGPSSTDEIELKQIFKLLYITVLVILGVVALFVLHVLAPLRRTSSHKLLHSVVLGTYTLSYILVAYTLGLMQSPEYYFNEFPVWAVCLLLLLGSTDSLMVCRLNEIDDWKSLYIKHLLRGGVVVYIVARFGRGSGYIALLWGMIVVIILKSYLRITSMRMASKSQLCKFVKPIADYVHHEHCHRTQASGQSPNPVTMDGYRYIVAGEGRQKFNVSRPAYMLTVTYSEEADVKITTVEQIWQCKGSLLCSNSERSLRLKDLCLSMALSKMLNRRFAGFELPEAGLDKTHDFVFRGLLVVGDMPYERAFRVIEVELAFIYDLYYTGYPYIYRKGRLFALYLPFAMVILCSWLTYKLNRRLRHHPEDDILRTTLFLMAVVTFLEVLQLYLHITSGWFKVALIRSYVTRPILRRDGSFFQIIIGLLLRLKALRPWEQKLGQYSLLQKFDGTCRNSNFLHYATLCLVDKAKKGRERGKLVKLSKQVKKAVVDSLVESNGHLTSGVRSLQNNGVHEKLSWACDATHTLATHTILIWHIATTLCKHQLDAQVKGKQLPVLSEEDRSMIDVTSSVASNLSQYCAYLIAFAPNLLPDHSSASSMILDKSIEEARQLLKGAKTMKSKYKKLMSMTTPEDHLVVLGARLARQLNEDIQDPLIRWKVLSDFWAEMLLYAAPSDDARAHLEGLPRGGEFITHLWALLTHAGVLKQSPTRPLSDV